MTTSTIWLASFRKSSFVRGCAETSASRSALEVPEADQLGSTEEFTDNLPPYAAAPNKSAAFPRSDLSSRSFANLALSAGLSTASESYSCESSPSALLAAFSASFSASFALRVPFFFGGATTGLTSSSSEESSQSD